MPVGDTLPTNPAVPPYTPPSLPNDWTQPATYLLVAGWVVPFLSIFAPNLGAKVTGLEQALSVIGASVATAIVTAARAFRTAKAHQAAAAVTIHALEAVPAGPTATVTAGAAPAIPPPPTGSWVWQGSGNVNAGAVPAAPTGEGPPA